MFMTFKFFTFPETNTSSCKLTGDEEEKETEVEKLEANQNYKLVRETPDSNEINRDDQMA